MPRRLRLPRIAVLARETDPRSGGDRAINEVVEAYVRWTQECAGARQVFERGCGAGGRAGVEATHGYLAAIDREERAAEVYQDLLRRRGTLIAAALRV